MAVSLFWIGAPYLLMGFSHDYWLLLTCAALVGIGNNLWHPTAIPLLAQRYPDRKGLVVSIHGMGGNVGDALAPLVAGALLAVLSWREVVVINVIPGIVMSVVLLVLLGRTLATAVRPHEAKAPKRTLRDTLRDFKPLLANRTLIFLCASSVFRSMTHGGLMTFLPLYLADRHGLFADLDRRLHGGVADRRIHRRADRRSSVRQDGPPPDRHEQHGDDGGGDRGDDRRRRVERLRVLHRLPGLLLLLDPRGAAGLAARCDAAEHGRLLDRRAVRDPVVRLGLGPIVCGLIADRYGLIATFYFLVGTIIVANMLIFFTPVGDKPLEEKARFAGQPAE